MSCNSSTFPVLIPKVNIVAPAPFKRFAAGRGSPPLLNPSVIRNTAFFAFDRAFSRIL